MNREILFRGRRCDSGEWVEGYYIRATHHWHEHGIHGDWIACGASANGGWFALHNKYPVKGETVGQYTGLNDKNGKRIFEGDVLKITWSAQGRNSVHEAHIVVYSKSGFFTEKNGKLGGQVSNYACSNCKGLFVEVIGNIHDNPELLKEET